LEEFFFHSQNTITELDFLRVGVYHWQSMVTACAWTAAVPGFECWLGHICLYCVTFRGQTHCSLWTM